jgi:hypothetical protein
VIGDNVFVGINAIIMKGVKIGGNSIIGAVSVVTKDVPPNSVAAGNPCKVLMDIKELYDKTNKRLTNLAQQFAQDYKQQNTPLPTETTFWKQFLLWMEKKGKIDREWAQWMEPYLLNLAQENQIYREIFDLEA